MRSQEIELINHQIKSWTTPEIYVGVDNGSQGNGETSLYFKGGSNALVLKSRDGYKTVGVEAITGNHREVHLDIDSKSALVTKFYLNLVTDPHEKMRYEKSDVNLLLYRLAKEPKILGILGDLVIVVAPRTAQVKLLLNNHLFEVGFVYSDGVREYKIITPLGIIRQQDGLFVDTFIHAMKQVMQLGYD